MTSLLKIADVVEVVVDDDDNNTRDVSLLEENMMLMEEPDDEDEDEDEDDIYSRPIVVGYAFGPKKMSTMGAVMAEASKAKLSTATASVATTTAGASNLFFDTHSAKEADLSSSAHPTASPSPCTLTQARLTKHEGKVEEEEARNKGDASQAAANFVFTIDNGQIQGDLRNIVQHFRSSCSSVGSVSTGVTACSTSVTSAPRTSRASMSCSSVASSFYNRKQQHPHHPQDSKLIPVRVSFVPLDPGKECCIKSGSVAVAWFAPAPTTTKEPQKLKPLSLLFCRHSARRATRWENGCHSAQAYRRYSLPLPNGDGTAKESVVAA